MSQKTNHKNLARKQSKMRDARAQQRRTRRMMGAGAVAALVVIVVLFLTLRPGKDAGSPLANGECVPGAKPASTTFTKPFDMSIDPKASYTAIVCTAKGPITIALTPATAPNAVNNFVNLAKSDFYNGLTFHRVIDGFMIQGGDPQGTGQGGPGYSFPDELSGGETYPVGTVAMANSGPDTNGSQFFIVTGPQGASLPPDYVVFGKVTKGQQVADSIQTVETGSGDKPVQDVVMQSVTIQENGLAPQT